MSIPLYIKHRPKLLDDMFGHKRVVEALKKRILENNVPQVILFIGSTGKGKTTLARIIAKSLVCSDLQGYNPCNRCKFCLDIEEESFQIFREYDATQMKKDDVRGLSSTVERRSLLTAKKIIFIDEVDSLQAGTMQPLYKLLERKQDHTYFILGAMSSIKVPAVVRDRMVTYKLHDSSYQEIGEYLFHVCKLEGVKIDEEKARILLLIGENCGHSFRGAVSLLETVLESDLWTEDELYRELSIISDEKLINIAGKILTGDISVMSNSFDEDLIKKLRFIYLLIYKKQNGLELNNWEDKQTGNLHKQSTESVINVITAFNELQKFNYLTPQLIEFYTINAIVANKKLVKQPDVQPQQKRRRISEN